MHRLETFGRLTLTNGEAERPQPRRRLALLARLAPPGARGVSRDELLALFWPERDLESARHSLDQLLYEARRAFGASPTLGTASLRLDPEVIASDVAEWTAAIEGGDLETAAALYRGPFLHGFYVSASPEFERWVDAMRLQFAAEYRRLLETLATRATADGRLGDAVEWWRRLAMEDRFGSRAAVGLMRALVDIDDRAGALEFARVHERIVRVELETAPDPVVAEYADALRAGSRSAGLRLALPANHTADDGVAPDVPRRAAAAAIVVPQRRRIRAIQIAAVAAVTLVAVITSTVMLRSYQPARTQTSGTGPPFRVATTGALAATSARPVRYETMNIAAHEYYMRGQDPVLVRSDSGQRAAIGYLERAVSLDTTYAAGYAALASMYVNVAMFGPVPVSQRRDMAKRAEIAARHAIALDDSLADAHAELGYVFLLMHQPAQAAAELERALALDPKATFARELLAKAYEWLGRPAAAVAVTRDAYPLSASARAELGDALYFSGRYDEALAELQTLAGVQPPLRRVPEYTAEIYIATGRWSDAVAALRPRVGETPFAAGLFGYALVRSGARAEALQLLERAVAEDSAGRARAATIAELYVALGDYDQAFVWINRAFDDYSLRSDIMGPVFNDFRADPRFERVRRRLGLAR